MPSSTPTLTFAELVPGTDLGRLEVTVSAAANARYVAAAGLDHPLLRDALYPPIAANLTILLFGGRCPDAMIQTRQRLRCHRLGRPGAALEVTGRVTDRYEKRGRTYVDVEAVVHGDDLPDAPLWTSLVTFTPVATFRS
jgi:hypothetical protein